MAKDRAEKSIVSKWNRKVKRRMEGEQKKRSKPPNQRVHLVSHFVDSIGIEYTKNGGKIELKNKLEHKMQKFSSLAYEDICKMGNA